jgi:hypothetical protein
MELQVLEHHLAAGESVTLEPATRVIYRIAEEEGDYRPGEVTLRGPVHALCFELAQRASPDAKLSAPVEPDGAEWLLRLDRVSFPAGAVAYTHVHRGPGIRVLLSGTIRIDSDGRSDSYGPLEAWFESGPVPVFAAASETEPTAFVRCMVLPGELLGRSSLSYVREEDADKPKRQRYTVFVDEMLTGSSVTT